jgi:putative effector of murein hydrolase
MKQFLNESVYLGVLLTIGSYGIGLWLKKKTGWAIFNPLLIGILLCMGTLFLTDIPYETYQQGSSMINYMLTPATICLAVPMYEQMQHLKSNPLAVSVGIISGVLSSMICILLMVTLMNMNHNDFVTLIPKSITTAIGIGVSEVLEGNVPVTIMAIVLTGITGNIIAEKFLKLIGITHPIARGVAIGTSSHVIGTSKAMEMGETEGAMSSLAIVTSGIVTVLLAPLFSMLY